MCTDRDDYVTHIGDYMNALLSTVKVLEPNNDTLCDKKCQRIISEGVDTLPPSFKRRPAP